MNTTPQNGKPSPAGKPAAPAENSKAEAAPAAAQAPVDTNSDAKNSEPAVADGAANPIADGKAGKPVSGPDKNSVPAKPVETETVLIQEKGPVVEPKADVPEGDIPPVVAAAKPRDRLRPVRIWLWIMVLLVFAIVVVGGATRLTESGLSITEWNPVTGVVPPTDGAGWNVEFDKYKKTSQFKEQNSSMTLAQFKTIYYWEWGHRLLGRIIGAVFVLPFLFFLFTRRLNFGLTMKLLALLALGGLQGLVGWWMVKSGLAGRTEVAAERLAIHLLLASITLVGLVWVAMGLKQRPSEGAARDMRGEASGIIVAILIQIGLGALVAGSKAGLTYNTWPMMDGHIVPAFDKLLKLEPVWRNFVDNPTMVQFQHRMFAYLLLLILLAHAFKAAQLVDAGKLLRRSWALVIIALGQAALGVFTLLYVVPSGKLPIHLALAHQAVAMVLLITAVIHRAAMGKRRQAQVDGGGEPKKRAVQAHLDDTAIAT